MEAGKASKEVLDWGMGMERGGWGSGEGGKDASGVKEESKAVYSSFILGRLQTMNWRRVDVGWEGASMKAFAHNNI